MTAGTYAWGAHSWGAVSGAGAPTAAEILASPGLTFILQVELQEITNPDDGAAEPEQHFWSSRQYVTKPSDTPASTWIAPDIIGLGIDRTVNISPLTNGDNGFRGTATLNNVDGVAGALFRASDYARRPASIYALRKAAGADWPHHDDDAFADATLRLRAVISAVSIDQDVVTIELSDLTHLLDRPVQGEAARYAGTGGYAGDDGVEGQEIPFCLGRIVRQELQMIDRDRVMYQMQGGALTTTLSTTAGALQTINIYDAGLFLNNAGTSTDLLSETIAPGDYMYDPTRGLVALGALPSGRVSGTFNGACLVRDGVARATPADLALALLDYAAPDYPVERGSFLSIADVFRAANSASGRGYAIAGIRVQPGETIRAVLDRLLTPVGIQWFNGRDGRMRLMFLAPPTTAQVRFRFGALDIIGEPRLVRLPDSLAPPPLRPNGGFNQCFSPQRDGLAGSLDESVIQFIGQEWRVTTPDEAGNADIAAQWPQAQAWPQINTNLLIRGDADWVMDNLVAAHTTYRASSATTGDYFVRQLIDVPLGPAGLLVEPGDVVELTWPDYGLDSGKLFVAFPTHESYVDDDVVGVRLLCWGGFGGG